MNDKKYCVCCEEEKLLSEFPVEKDKRRRNPYSRNECKECRNKRRRGYIRPDLSRWKRCKYDSERRNIDFALTLEQFLSFRGVLCEYCGAELDAIRLDRVDNNLGYFLENVVACCAKCNSFKHTLKEKEFLEHANKIYLYQNNRKENCEQKNSFKETSEENVINPKRIRAGNRRSLRDSYGWIKEWRRDFPGWLREILSL